MLKKYILCLSSLSLLFTASISVSSARENVETEMQSVRVDRQIITQEQQAKMTPDEIIALLKAGNMRYVNNNVTRRDHSELIRQSISGQYPKAIVLSCVDSRVPVEDVFDLSIGDIFVARVAGNFVNQDILGSMEYATKVANSKVIVVMGHEHCGAVKATIDGAKMGNVKSIYENIQPAVQKAQYFKGVKSSKNDEYVKEVCEHNVQHNIQRIRKESNIIAKLEKEGKVKIVGAMYDMDTGRVIFL